MSAQIASTVRSRLGSPTPGETVSLIVGYSGDAEDAIEAMSDAGGEVEEKLPYNSVAVTIEEVDLEALCSLDVVTTVEIEKQYETRGDTDFRSQ